MATQEAFIGTTTEVEKLKKNGFYAQGAYKFKNGLEPVLRYDQVSFRWHSRR